MATYVIGDVQGCFTALQQLLKKINFNSSQDQLIFCGDLVNRGGQSLDVLRWIYAHQYCCDSVLGNHDLSLLSKYFSDKSTGINKEFNTIFNASDSELLISWLLNRPLLIELEHVVIIHAGLYPLWSLNKIKNLAMKTSKEMTKDPKKFFSTMYGNSPKKWSNELTKEQQFRFVINAMTRMRFVKKDGSLNFSENRKITSIKSLIPWFQFNQLNSIKKHIIFGHWSALGLYQDQNVTALDTGKVWGGQLTALRLDDKETISV